MISFGIFITFVVALYALRKVNLLENKIIELEFQLRNQTSSHTVSNENKGEAISMDAELEPRGDTNPLSLQDLATPRESSEELVAGNAFIAWIKKDFLAKLGAFLLLISFGWFASYAFANSWIGPAGRIVGGIGGGVLFMALGVWRIKQFAHQGAIFTVLGSTIVLLTIFAAREIYDFFTPATALIVMTLAVVFVAYVAVLYERKELAIASVVSAGFAPLLTNSTDPNTFMLFAYLLCVVLGSLWVVTRLATTILPLLAFGIVVLYSAPYWVLLADTSEHTVDTTTSLMFGFVFVGVFFISNIVSFIKSGDAGLKQAHLLLAGGVGLYALAWVGLGIFSEWKSFVYIIWALIFAIGAYAVYMRTQQRAPFYVYSGVALTFLGVATATLFEGPLLVIAFALEVSIIVLSAQHFSPQSNIPSRLSALFALPVLLSLAHIDTSAWDTGILHEDFFVLIVVASVLFGCGFHLLRSIEEMLKPNYMAGVVLMTLSGIYGLMLIWLTTHAVLPYDLATMLSLITYTIIGLFLYIRGLYSANTPFRYAGAILIAFVVLRLLFIDVWQMELTGRIITFFLVGMLLISTAFLGKFSKSNKFNS